MKIPCGPDRSIQTLTQAVSIAQDGDVIVLDPTPSGYELPQGGMPKGVSVVSSGTESISLHHNRIDVARARMNRVSTSFDLTHAALQMPVKEAC